MSLSISDIIERISNSGKKETVDFLMKYAEDQNIPLADKRSFSKTCETIQARYKIFRKTINKQGGQLKLNEYTNSVFIFPKPLCNSNNGANKGQTLPTDVKELQRQVENLTKVNCSLARELDTATAGEYDLKQKLQLKEARGIGKKQLVQNLKSVKVELKNVKRQNLVLNKRVKCKSVELKRLRSNIDFLKKQIGNEKVKKEHVINDLQEQVSLLKNEYSELYVQSIEEQELVNNLREENTWLQDTVQQISNEEVVLFDNDKKMYNEKLQTCAYSLLENHVPERSVGPVISIVLSLAEKKANRLPSVSTIHNMNLQRLVLSQKHIAEVLVEKPNMCIYTDETCKFGNKVCGYHVRDQEGNYFTLGLRDLATKSASDTLDTFREILSDIDKAAETGDETSRKILVNISATMSDSAATEVKFNSLLEEYRAAVLPYTVKNYINLDEQGKMSISRLANFFCGLHSLIHFAEAATQAANEVEKQLHADGAPIHESSFKRPNEPGTIRLISTASKAFSRGADEKSGCHLPFVTFISEFLKENKFRSLKLVPFRGHRFNILFHNAGQVYWLHNKMSDFLKGQTLNRLTKSVEFDLAVTTYIAGCKALGIVSKIISTPFWNLIENKNINILEMDKYYLMLTSGLKDAAENVPEFMKGNVRPFGDTVKVKEDVVYEALTEDSDYDNECELFLSVILAALTKYCERKFKDYLPGGKLCDASEEMKMKVKSVEKHNKFSERIFAYYDNLLRYKPHIQTLASEAYVAFSVNKTGDWLREKSQDEVKFLVAQARKHVDTLRQQFKKRQALINQRRTEKLEENRRLKEEAEAKRVKVQEEITNQMVYYGLWQSEESVDTILATIKTKQEKVKALKSQLKFRKDVLKQMTDDKTVYKYSSKEVSGKTRQLTVDDLTVNVKRLVGHAKTLHVTENQEGPILVGRRVRHKFIRAGDPEGVFYIGKVISQVPGYPEWFNITYEEDEAVYTYKLMEDYGENLQIIV